MTDFQVLLATIYVAIIVPFNASFPDTFDSKFCDALANVTSSSSDAQSLFASNETSPTGSVRYAVALPYASPGTAAAGGSAAAPG